MSSVVGVDIGFKNSVIAAAGRGGVDVILNGNSNRLNPTMIGFDDYRKMGENATSGVTSNFKGTVTSLKRLVGLPFDDPRAEREMKDLPLTFVPIPHASGGPPSVGVKVQLAGQETTLSMEAILGMMIYHMGEIAAQKAHASDPSIPVEKLMPQDWVVAIPNYYTDAQRRAVLTACQIVGINGVNKLIHENTATALAYGIFKDLRKEFTKDAPANVMFIDMGASAYTVSIASFEPGTLTVKSAYCDAQLGGRDFDQVIGDYVANDFSNKFKGKLSVEPMKRPKTRLKILAAAEKAKKTLSPAGVKETRITLEMLQDDFDYNGKLLTTDYEAMCAPLLARLEGPIQSALAEAKLKPTDLAAVEIVGGSTRIGCVKRKLVEILGMNLSTTMNADEAVARGAALQSAILSPRFKVLPYDIVESQPYPIKIRWDDQMEAGVEVDASGSDRPTDSVVMFDRGLTFPIVRRVTLRRQDDFAVKAVYDDAVANFGVPSQCGKDIAEFSVKAAVKEERKIRINVKNDANGIIQLTSAQMVEEVEPEEGDGAADKKEGETTEEAEKKKKIVKTNLEANTRRPLDWTTDELNKANEAEVAMANNDRLVRETAHMRNELESYIYDMRDKISSDSQLGPYGTDEEKASFTAKNEAMENWLYEDGFDAKKSVYVDKLAELKALGSPIEKRQAEANGRAAAQQALQSSIELYQNWVKDSQANEAFAHITDEDWEKVRSATDATSSWMYEMLDKQGSLALSVDPVLTVADLSAKNKELQSTCGPIMRKHPPKKKEEPKKDPAPAPAADSKSDEGNGEKTDPMDVEGGVPAEESKPMDTD